MENRFYPDINYQARIYYELVAQYKGVEFKKYKKTNKYSFWKLLYNDN